MSSLRQAAKNAPWRAFGVLLAFIAIGVILTYLYFSINGEKALSTASMIFHLAGGVTGILIAILGATWLILDMVSLEIQRENALTINESKDLLLQRITQLEEELRAGVPVQLVESPDEIWTKSISMLEHIGSGEYYSQHAYDVTTYMNKIRYEEAVANLLENQVTFNRVFCFDRQDQQESDLALNWFLSSIEDGHQPTKEELMPFETEILYSLKERQTDLNITEITDDHIQRIGTLIEKLHRHWARGTLTIRPLPYRMHIDFVAITYMPSRNGGTRYESSPRYEVMANFKTQPTGESYVVGTYATGALAHGYIELFINILSA